MLQKVESNEAVSFWQDVDPNAMAGLNEFQKNAILDAVKKRSETTHASDIRLSAFGFFLVILFGRERRSRERLKEERSRRPVFARKNIVMISILWGCVLFALYNLTPFLVHLVLTTIL